jgi:hypothetical protein
MGTRDAVHYQADAGDGIRVSPELPLCGQAARRRTRNSASLRNVDCLKCLKKLKGIPSLIR